MTDSTRRILNIAVCVLLAAAAAAMIWLSWHAIGVLGNDGVGVAFWGLAGAAWLLACLWATRRNRT